MRASLNAGHLRKKSNNISRLVKSGAASAESSLVSVPSECSSTLETRRNQTRGYPQQKLTDFNLFSAK
jgi:hypothetical protein